MRFTHKDLVKAMGLKIGDKVIVKESGNSYTINNKYQLINKYGDEFTPLIICNEEFEIVKTIQVGKQLCNKIECDDDNCPLYRINCSLLKVKDNQTLYDRLEAWHNKYKDDEIYSILKARLDIEE